MTAAIQNYQDQQYVFLSDLAQELGTDRKSRSGPCNLTLNIKKMGIVRHRIPFNGGPSKGGKWRQAVTSEDATKIRESRIEGGGWKHSNPIGVNKRFYQKKLEVRAEKAEAVISSFYREYQLDKSLEENWDELFPEWNLISVQHSEAELIIDMLANHKTLPISLVIENKKGKAGYASVGQCLAYITNRRKNLPVGNRVEGLIICAEADEALRAAMEGQKIECMEYTKDGDKITLRPLGNYKIGQPS